MEIIPLELGTFQFPERELAGRRGVVMGYQASGANGTGTQRTFTLYVLCYRR